MSYTVSEGEKQRILECIGTVLAGKLRVIDGYRVKVIGYDHMRKGVIVQYLDTRELSILTKVHEVRRLI
jgi:hypothetical protein